MAETAQDAPAPPDPLAVLDRIRVKAALAAQMWAGDAGRLAARLTEIAELAASARGQ